MSGHDKAINAALQAYYREGEGLNYSDSEIADLRRAIAAFLRAWEPKFGHVWNQASVKVAANHTADELEGGT